MNKQYKLVDKNGNVIKIGDIVTSFRGESATVKGFNSPQCERQSGKVWTTLGEHYAGVYGLKYIEV